MSCSQRGLAQSLQLLRLQSAPCCSLTLLSLQLCSSGRLTNRAERGSIECLFQFAGLFPNAERLACSQVSSPALSRKIMAAAEAGPVAGVLHTVADELQQALAAARVSTSPQALFLAGTRSEVFSSQTRHMQYGRCVIRMPAYMCWDQAGSRLPHIIRPPDAQQGSTA